MSSRMYGECRWLVEILEKKKKISLREINELWLKDEIIGNGIEIGRKKMKRHRDAIKLLYSIKIECDIEDGNKYYISNPEALQDRGIAKWMMNVLAISEKLQAYNSLHDRILLEPVPSADKRFDIITNAMLTNHLVSFDYLRYGSIEEKPVDIKPYCLKYYRQRLYLLGRYDSGNFSTYCIDRMSNVRIHSKTFEMDPEFNASVYFEDIIGVVKRKDKKVQRIVIRAFDDEGYYLEDVPLHQSQKKLGQTERYMDFEYHLQPNLEFMGLILQRGSRLKLLSPDSMAEEISNIIVKMKENYCD